MYYMNMRLAKKVGHPGVNRINKMMNCKILWAKCLIITHSPLNKKSNPPIRLYSYLTVYQMGGNN